MRLANGQWNFFFGAILFFILLIRSLLRFAAVLLFRAMSCRTQLREAKTESRVKKYFISDGSSLLSASLYLNLPFVKRKLFTQKQNPSLRKEFKFWMKLTIPTFQN